MMLVFLRLTRCVTKALRETSFVNAVLTDLLRILIFLVIILLGVKWVRTQFVFMTTDNSIPLHTFHGSSYRIFLWIPFQKIEDRSMMYDEAIDDFVLLGSGSRSRK